MSRVFILGASGFLGSHIAGAFTREGYQVTGLTRSEDKAKVLRAHEITPIIGKAQDTKVWEPLLESADIIIEALADFQDYTTAGTVQKVLVNFAQKHPNKHIIYTSGVWVYGSSSKLVDENDKPNPIPIVKTRPDLENAYLAAGVTVIRPGCVYGRQGSLTGMWFGSLLGGKNEFPGSGTHSWATVHVNDIADLYVKATQKRGISKGNLFNGVSQSEKVKDCLAAAARVVGFKGEIKFVAPTDLLSEALALDQFISSQKAKALLGWEPKQLPFTVGVEQYYHAFAANQGQQGHH